MRPTDRVRDWLAAWRAQPVRPRRSDLPHQGWSVPERRIYDWATDHPTLGGSR